MIAIISIVFISGCVQEETIPIDEELPTPPIIPEPIGPDTVIHIDVPTEDLTVEQVMEIAQNSNCMEIGSLTEEYCYNDDTKTWWIDLDMKEEFEKEYCHPACVVYEFTKTTEINWRCMGGLL